jgi:heat shock protein HslJ
MRCIFIILTLVCFSSCNSSENITLPEGEWKLTRLNGQDASTLEIPLTINFDKTESNASGYAGCNRYFATYQTKASDIRFTDIGSTKMFCEDVMETESKFLETLDSVKSFKLEGNMFQLLKGDSVLLEFKR